MCGDSGNDLSMFARGFRGVVVGNAQQELKSMTHPDIYHSDRSFAAGVMEGLEHWLNLSTRARAQQIDSDSTIRGKSTTHPSGGTVYCHCPVSRIHSRLDLET